MCPKVYQIQPVGKVFLHQRIWLRALQANRATFCSSRPLSHGRTCSRASVALVALLDDISAYVIPWAAADQTHGACAGHAQSQHLHLHGSRSDCRKLVNVSTIGVRHRSDVLVSLYRQDSSWILTIVALLLTAEVLGPLANNREIEAHKLEHANLLGITRRTVDRKDGYAYAKERRSVEGFRTYPIWNSDKLIAYTRTG